MLVTRIINFNMTQITCIWKSKTSAIPTGSLFLFPFPSPLPVHRLVRKFHQPTANRSGTARQKPVGGTLCPPLFGLNRVNPKQHEMARRISSCRIFISFCEDFSTFIDDIDIPLNILDTSRLF